MELYRRMRHSCVGGKQGRNKNQITFVKVCGGIQVTSAIEIGCGTGAVLKRLQELKFAEHFVCVDVSHSAVTFAGNVYGNSMSNASVASATALPFRNAAFDVAILSHIIEHLHEPAQALAEASRIARYVVVEVPTEVVLSNAIRRNMLREPFALIEAAGHEQFWSTRSIKRLLKRDCSLEILENHGDLISKEAEFPEVRTGPGETHVQASAEGPASSGAFYARADESLDVFV